MKPACFFPQYYDTEFTLWDRFEVQGDMTLKEFMEYFQVIVFIQYFPYIGNIADYNITDAVTDYNITCAIK